MLLILIINFFRKLKIVILRYGLKNQENNLEKNDFLNKFLLKIVIINIFSYHVIERSSDNCSVP